MSQEKFFYGGQAVLEGVMMRGRTTYAVAVRRPDGEIQVLRERLRSIIYTHRFWKMPLLRGLAVPTVRTQSTLHPRCGTGFLLAVMVVSAFVFGLVGRPALPLLLLSRIVLIPLIAMLAYEFIRFAGRHRNHPVVKVLIIPFLL